MWEEQSQEHIYSLCVLTFDMQGPPQAQTWGGGVGSGHLFP